MRKAGFAQNSVSLRGIENFLFTNMNNYIIHDNVTSINILKYAYILAFAGGYVFSKVHCNFLYYKIYTYH